MHLQVTCQIGCRANRNMDNSRDYFDGLIDEVRVLERALSADEIQQEMSMPWCSKLILHLGFNEGYGTVLHDSSENQLHVDMGQDFHVGGKKKPQLNTLHHLKF